ncbi:MAG TPA: RNA-binding protein [Chitinophaga sp.]|uniref:RNA recognition motif domain-containing protein n=1 Tax=Chitinophaga sp. TaxID=1869181 RepID=UPI002DBB20EA|nr:RNA-binding protein [Chitinophaga sp.]HEU4554659.1 RNA-binding protein [Chitinophaga sp.]
MNINVSNLMPSFREEDLRKLFTKFGQVASCNIITDIFTGASKGTATVEMPDNNAAMEAIAQLDGQRINGRPIAVSMAAKRPMQPAGSRMRYGH